MIGLFGSYGATAAARQQASAYMLAQQQVYDSALSQRACGQDPFANAYQYRPTALQTWWDKLQRRGRELGEDDMPYAEWLGWMEEFEAFKAETDTQK